MSKTNYIRSNKITKIDFKPSSRAVEAATLILKVKETALARQLHSQILADQLSSSREIDLVKVKISDTTQYHKKSNGRVVFKQYGYYKPANKYIYIQNLTAVRAKPLAAKTFLDTLLHEWLHHYDHQALKLDSIHTKGFYERLKHLKLALKV